MIKASFFCCFLALLLSSCFNGEKKLPILGDPLANGKDTIYPKIADFSFVDQDSIIVTNATFSDNIYVTDFIFLSCPTTCPVMTKEMKQVYKVYENDNRVKFLSHSIDPERDTVARLRGYANSLGVTAVRWHFVTGNQDSIMQLAEHSYFSSAFPDSTAPGGFVHSGGMLLVDKNRHIRGVYNALEPDETKRLIADIKQLLQEQF